MEDYQFNLPRYKNNTSSFFSPSRSRPVVTFRDLSNHTNNQNDNEHITPKSAFTRCIYGTAEQLSSAIENRDQDTVAELLSNHRRDPVDVNQVISKCSMSLLHLSVGFSNNQTEIVEMLLRQGGDPNNTNIEEGLSPLHLSAMYDYDRVMVLLMDYGGDPEVKSTDGQNCYEIVMKNVEDECNEKCFSYFFKKSAAFRKSMRKSLHVSSKNSRRQMAEDDSGTSEGFISCESHLPEDSKSQSQMMMEDVCHNLARKLFPADYMNLMTEDESMANSNDSSYFDDQKNKLTTIHEESGVVASASVISPLYDYSTPSPLVAPRGRGIGSITCPQFVLTDDDDSGSMSDPSCINSTPPITPQPTQEELLKLKEQMKQLRVPVTPSTFGVLARYTDENRLEALMTPKTGTGNFSPELQAGIQDLNLINEWGNHKIDFLQKEVPTVNASKSFDNYLLLDPRVIKKVNFSGDGHKSAIINCPEKFEKFLHSIFYVGKGHKSRPLDHLVDAKTKYVELGKKPADSGEKINKIIHIWRSGLGVIIVRNFEFSSEREANVYEASMIDAMGLLELSNQKRGSYAGTVASKWSQKMKNQLGSFLLYKCFQKFAVSDCKQFYPHNF